MKKYIIAGIFAIVLVAAGILVFYNYKDDSKQEINIKADEPQNDIFVSSFYDYIKEIKNPMTGMITSDEAYIQQIADVLSQFNLKHAEKETAGGEIKYGWTGIEFKYNDSDRIVTVGVCGENEINVAEDKYIVENDNYKELIKEFTKLVYYIPKDIARMDKLYPQSQ